MSSQYVMDFGFAPSGWPSNHLSLQNPAVKDIEAKIGCGQVEELIVQAENELILARKMLGWRPWEQLVNQAPPKQWDWPPAVIHKGQ